MVKSRKGVDILNKVAVVTGATSGIGKACVELLLKSGVDVIGIGRDDQKMNQLIATLGSIHHTKLTMVKGDLGTNESVKHAADEIISVVKQNYEGTFDLLFHVAGRVSSGYHENIDGNEVTFATNHLSSFLLTHYLYPHMLLSKDPRILVVSSRSHYRASINYKNLQNKTFYNIFKAYKRSKLYNVFFVKGFANKMKNIPIYAIDPGLVNTDIGLKGTNKLAQYFWKKHAARGTDIYYPAGFMIDIALKPEYLSLSGHYFLEGKAVKSNPITYRLDHMEHVWHESLKYTKIDHYFTHK
jgi:NAD(P)-dependent dehydrogenase (short-subunit alcohol dehydrogenase family)